MLVDKRVGLGDAVLQSPCGVTLKSNWDSSSGCVLDSGISTLDGGGLCSTADWLAPRASHDVLRALRKRFENLAVKSGSVQRLRSLLRESTGSCLFSNEVTKRLVL